MPQSILDSTKKILGIEADNTAFDVDLIMHINNVFSTLNQIGIGPDAGFAIEDDSATWEDFLETDPVDPRLNSVKIYTYLKVRILFDPPQGSYHLMGAMQQQITELEWRLNVTREGDKWVDPAPAKLDPDNVQYVPIPVNDYYNAEG